MNRSLQVVNFLGVIVLAALCGFQWQRDRKVNLALRESEKTRQAHEQKLDEQAKNLRGLNEDLTEFKQQVERQSGEAKEFQKKLQEFERENVQLTTERDQLGGSVMNWSNAVTLRDVRLTEANERIRSLAEDMNNLVQKYNTLATNYNKVVDDLNQVRTGKTNSPTAAVR